MVLLVAGLISLFTGPVIAGNPPIHGDVNGDLRVDIGDAVKALQIIDHTGSTVNIDADVDNDGKIGIGEALFVLQKVAELRPAFQNEAPMIVTSDAASQIGTYVFTGMVSPEVASLSYTLNGGASHPIAITDGAFSVTLTLNPGSNSICTKAVDASGSSQESCVTAVYDPIMGVSPYSQTRSYTLFGMVSSPSVKSLTYRLNGGASQQIVGFNPSYGFFTAAGLMLSAGDNTVCIRSAGASGNLIYDSCFNVIWSPVGVSSESQSASSSYTLTGMASPGDVLSLGYSLNNGQRVTVANAEFSSGEFSIPIILSPGANSICLKATDGPNFTGNVVGEFCYGVTYSPVAITSKGYSPASGYTFTGTATADVTAMSYTFNNGASQPITIAGGAFSVPFTLKPGGNDICTVTTITAGTTGTSCFHVVYDTGLPSSFALIANARKVGTITAEEALIYRVYAAFGDPRLPAQFKGDDSFAEYSGIQAEIRDAAPTLSEAAKDILGPFLAPPFYQGSWHDVIGSLRAPASGLTSETRQPLDAWCNPLRPGTVCPFSGDWEYVDGAHIRVWYLKANQAVDKPKAEKIVDLVDGGTAAWNKMTTYMARGPMSDADSSFNGGDGRLDISLIDLNDKGLTFPRGSDSETQNPIPVYVLINRNEPLDTILFATIHELMHAIQFNFPTASTKRSYYTLMESTAQFAGHIIFNLADRTNKHDQDHVNSYLKRTNEPLVFEQVKQFAYGLYLFPLYLSMTNTNKVVRDMWDFAGTSDQVKAIDRALNKQKTDLKRVWPKFALKVWNQEPVLDPLLGDFKVWDDMQLLPHDNSLQEYEVTANNRKELDADLPAFSTRYYHFKFNDPNVRSLLFLNGLNFKLAETKARTSKGAEVTTYSATRIDDWTLTRGAKVQALVKKKGKWVPLDGKADWSLEPFKAFCRDKADERIEELVLIFTAGDLSGKPFSPLGLKPMLWASDVPCGPGKFSAGISCNNEVDTKAMNVSDVVYDSGGWDAARGDINDDKTYYAPIERKYGFKGGKVDWNATQNGNNGSGSENADEVAGFDLHNIAFVRSGGGGYKGYFFTANMSMVYNFTQSCPAGLEPSSIICGVGASFTIKEKATFDSTRNLYLRQVMAGDIAPNGPGDDFSDPDMSIPVGFSPSSRIPLDETVICVCPSGPGGGGVPDRWKCEGSWSLIGTPEP